MPFVHAASSSLVRVTSPEAPARPGWTRSRLRRTATLARLVAADVAAVAGAAAALMPLLARRRPLGRAPAEDASPADERRQARLLSR